MLTKQDLQAIANLIDIKFETNFKKYFNEYFDRKFNEAFDRKFNEAFDRKFDEAFDRKFDEKIGDFAIMIQREFKNIYAILETKADKKDIDRVENRVIAIESKFNLRLPKIEDDVRIIKTSLKIS